MRKVSPRFFHQLSTLAFGCAVSAGLFVAHTPEAFACGGCFHQPNPSMSQQVVTDHRMVVAVHGDESILWDQIRYAGDPQDFAWVLPVWGDVRVEIASETFFNELEASTPIAVEAPPLPSDCFPSFGGGAGCGGGSIPFAPTLQTGTAGFSDAGSTGVTVLRENTVGPYQTVTLRSETGTELIDWLRVNSYTIPPSIEPIIQYYSDRRMDFVALRLRPGQNVQAMRPVRIVYRSSNMVLPLRMVSAGIADKVGITLWVFGYGRYEAANFGNGTIDPQQVIWDYSNNTTNYQQVFQNTMTRLGGRAWITELSSSAPDSIGVTMSDSQVDWAYTRARSSSSRGNNNWWVTRMRTDLAARFLDTDLQLRAATNVNGVVNGTVTAGRANGRPAICPARAASVPEVSDFRTRPILTSASILFLLSGLLFVRRTRRN